MTSSLKCSPSASICKLKRETASIYIKETAVVVPDSTTVLEEMSAFCIGEDVLLKQKDGCFYFGTIVQVNPLKEQCMVKFGDNTDRWSSYKDITKLSTPQSQEDLLCVVCKKSAPKTRNEIIVCDKCGRGYHRMCHLPEISTKSQKDDSEWKCRRCVINEPYRLRKSDSKTNNYHKRVSRTASADSHIESSGAASNTKVLPYHTGNQTWEIEHRITSSPCRSPDQALTLPEDDVLDNTSELNTPFDTSGDETSSKSTLDLIIPPLKDFEGKNNPFVVLLGKNNSQNENQRQKKKRRCKDTITLPLPLTAVKSGAPQMRPKKRQLSEKDIYIGPNGEVKRKKMRRGRCSNGNGVVTTTASKTATIVPIKADSSEWRPSSNVAELDYAFNGRRLRQRPGKNGANNCEKNKDLSEGNAPIMACALQSPIKQEPDDLNDLKSSVNMYFGAATRIAAGEPFVVKAQRIGPNGKLEFLIEWEGPSNGMT